MDDEQKDGFERYPQAPDLKRVHELRKRLRHDKAESESDDDPADSRLGRRYGKTAKDIGTYTMIPSLMIAGPVVGYLLGRGFEKLFGGEPWGAVVCMLLGVVAAFRQVFLLLQRKGRQDKYRQDKERQDEGRQNKTPRE